MYVLRFNLRTTIVTILILLSSLDNKNIADMYREAIRQKLGGYVEVCVCSRFVPLSKFTHYFRTFQDNIVGIEF
jgi:hypothetical protein